MRPQTGQSSRCRKSYCHRGEAWMPWTPCKRETASRVVYHGIVAGCKQYGCSWVGVGEGLGGSVSCSHASGTSAHPSQALQADVLNAPSYLLDLATRFPVLRPRPLSSPLSSPCMPAASSMTWPTPHVPPEPCLGVGRWPRALRSLAVPLLAPGGPRRCLCRPGLASAGHPQRL